MGLSKLFPNNAVCRKEKNQEFDLWQQRDSEGNAALCHGCQKGASSTSRMMMLCSACPLYWHLDCIETPMAHPANPKKWICPTHVDHFYNPDNVPLGRRFRKVRGSQVVKPVYSRGYKNNGVIEVDDTEEVENENASGWNDMRLYGRVLRLPARGIKLDFIEQYEPFFFLLLLPFHLLLTTTLLHYPITFLIILFSFPCVADD